MKKLFYFLCVILMFSCNVHKEDMNWRVKSDKNIQLLDLNIDTIRMDEVCSSYVGEVLFRDDSICFIDKRFCWIFTFDKEGKFGKRYLGKGSGPSEINTGLIDGLAKLSNGGFFFVGPCNDCHLFSEKLEREASFSIDNGNRNKKNINLSDFAIYTKMYPKLIFREYNGYLYSNQYCEHPEFDYIANKSYYKDAKLLSRMNIKSGKVDNLYANYPKMYSEKILNQFNLFSFDIDKKGNSYFCFEADSLIYKYDSNFNPLYSFGYKGTKMNTSYKCLDSFSKLKKDRDIEREEKSYYDWIKYIDEVDLLFRSYKKENSNSFDGMQIYRGSTLIGDVNVPKGFRVSGYIEPYIYSNVKIYEEDEKMEIYRFNITK